MKFMYVSLSLSPQHMYAPDDISSVYGRKNTRLSPTLAAFVNGVAVSGTVILCTSHSQGTGAQTGQAWAFTQSSGRFLNHCHIKFKLFSQMWHCQACSNVMAVVWRCLAGKDCE